MKHPLSIALPALLLASAPLVRPPALVSGAERAALSTASAPRLGSLRAGSTDRAPALGGAERQSLSRAQATSPSLGQERAGELSLSNRELAIIGIVVLAVIIIAAVA